MPNIKIIGLENTKVSKLSGCLSQTLAKIVDCPSDWFTFFCSSADSDIMFCEGEKLTDSVFIYVQWFDRGQAVKDLVAKAITEAIFSTNDETAKIENVSIIFLDTLKSDYYENGTHY